jgi:hypothetical protein
VHTTHDGRRLPRLPAGLTAERRIGERVIVDQVMNLSLSGMMLLSQHPVVEGSHLRVVLCGRRHAPIELYTEVVWARRSTVLPGIEAGLRVLTESADTTVELEELMTEVLSTPQGRRAAVRFSVSLAGWWRGATTSQMVPVELIDLSLSGAMFSGTHVPRYGERGLLALDLGEGLFAVPAAVAWRDLHRTPNGAGVAFDSGGQASEFVAKVVRAVLFVAAS